MTLEMEVLRCGPDPVILVFATGSDSQGDSFRPNYRRAGGKRPLDDQWKVAWEVTGRPIQAVRDAVVESGSYVALVGARTRSKSTPTSISAGGIGRAFTAVRSSIACGAGAARCRHCAHARAA